MIMHIIGCIAVQAKLSPRKLAEEFVGAQTKDDDRALAFMEKFSKECAEILLKRIAKKS